MHRSRDSLIVSCSVPRLKPNQIDTGANGHCQYEYTRRESCGGSLEPAVASDDLKAAMLVGAYVDGWSKHRMDAVDADAFDQDLAKLAASAGLLVEEPFPFVIEG